MKSQRPLTGSLQTKNVKCFSVINEYVNGARKQDWVYTGYKVASETKRKAQAALQMELFKRTQERNRPSRLKDASADMPFVDFLRLWLKMKKKSLAPGTHQG